MQKTLRPPGFRARCFRACAGSSTARGPATPCDSGAAGVAFRAWLADYHDSQDVLRPFVIYQLAECYRLTRDYAKAVQSYKKILDLYGSTTDPEVKKLVTLAQMRLGDIVPEAERRYGTAEPGEGDKR